MCLVLKLQCTIVLPAAKGEGLSEYIPASLSDWSNVHSRASTAFTQEYYHLNILHVHATCVPGWN